MAFAAQGGHWYCCHGDKEQAEEITPRLTCNQIRKASLACVQSLGITRRMHYQVADELADGRLVRGLKDYEPKDLPVQLVYPHALQMSPRVRAFVDWACPTLERVMPGLG
jgi:DNA-binding transcriptional LysR family regulator